jgi:Tol biopolymer transport system component
MGRYALHAGLIAWSGCMAACTTAPYAAGAPLPVPALFAPGTVSTGRFESHPAFTPDGRTLYFVRSNDDFSYWTIWESRWLDGRWSTPQVASFSGRHRDADPFVSADGRRLYFISDRPLAGEKKEDTDIWMMERAADGAWAAPRNLGSPVNSAGSEWLPTEVDGGALYFGSDRAGGFGRTDLYRAPRDGEGDGFSAPANLGAAVNSGADEYEPRVAPDESYMVFMAAGRAGEVGGGDLYFSRRGAGGWEAARPLGPAINRRGQEIAPYFSPDGRYFFFSSMRRTGEFDPAQRPDRAGNGLGDIYQMDLESLLQSVR